MYYAALVKRPGADLYSYVRMSAEEINDYMGPALELGLAPRRRSYAKSIVINDWYLYCINMHTCGGATLYALRFTEDKSNYVNTAHNTAGTFTENCIRNYPLIVIVCLADGQAGDVWAALPHNMVSLLNEPAATAFAEWREDNAIV